MKRQLIFTLSLISLCLLHVMAQEPAARNPYQEVLGAVPAPEMPGKAAGIVKQSQAGDLAKTTAEVTTAAVRINPPAAPAIVGAIARAVPEMAALAAGTAAAEQPKQAASIAKAAAAAAPKKAGKIVVAVCRAVPKDYRAIAVAVAEAVPGSAREILSAVASAIPELKPGVETVLATYTGNSISIAAALDEATLAKDGSGTSNGPPPRGPTVGPPFITLSGTPQTITPGSSGEVPTGGRNYARP